MRVYRIVDAQGCGMYRPAGPGQNSLWSMAIGNCNSTYAEPDPHPSAHNDAGIARNWPEFAQRHGLHTLLGGIPSLYDMHYVLADHRFGFGSLQQLRRWVFGVGWLQSMHECGGVVQVYEVPEEHVLMGICQVTFDSRYAERLDDMSLLDLE